MKTKNVTSQDVAKLAGVARSTVSHVLNGSNAVQLSEETRRKVKEAALKLGYKPNSAALMLRQGTTKTVGLLITEAHSLLVDNYIPLLFAGVGEVLRQSGYHLLLETLDDTRSVSPYADLVLTRRIDGLLILSPNPTVAELHQLVEGDFPVVLIGSIGSDKEFSVSANIDDAVTQAVAHMVSLGHRTFGHIPFSPAGFSAADARRQVLSTALAQHGLVLPDDAVEHADFSAESGNIAAQNLLARRPDITTIFAGNDTIALGAIGGATAAGYRVPEDLSIVGFDDLPFAAHMYPALTTIAQDAVEQGRMAAELLVQRLDGRIDTPIQQHSVGQFVARQSTTKANVS